MFWMMNGRNRRGMGGGLFLFPGLLFGGLFGIYAILAVLNVAGVVIGALLDHVRQIAGDALKNVNDESLKESVEREKRREQLKKQIAVLEAKMRKEKQFNKQVEMNGQLKRLKKELEGL